MLNEPKSCTKIVSKIQSPTLFYGFESKNYINKYCLFFIKTVPIKNKNLYN